MDIPLVKNGIVYPSETYLVIMIDIANQLLERIKKKIEKLNENLRNIK